MQKSMFFISSIATNAINEDVVAEYTDQYCLGLEAAYGQDMMSEGGLIAIEKMFSKVELKGKTALDIGSGVGGFAFYLAKNYTTQVTGVEINPWMVKEATRRISDDLKPLSNLFYRKATLYCLLQITV